MGQFEVYVSRDETETLEFSSERQVEETAVRVVRADLDSEEATDSVEIWHVHFHSELKLPGPDFNNAFPLRFYVPKTKASRLFLFINGFAEGHSKIWDHLGYTFAKAGVASVLVPLPQHFCRNIFFNIDDFDEDNYRLRSRENLTLYSNSLKFGLLAHPDMLVVYDRQMMADVQGLVKCVKKQEGAGHSPLEKFVKERFEPGVTCSILGFSIGGLIALQAFLNDFQSFNSCVVINSGASFQDMNASQVFEDHWRDLQRGILRSSSEFSRREKPLNFERIFLGHEKVALHDNLTEHQNKILILLGGSDPIFNRVNIVNVVPETGLAMFQIPGLPHFINIPSLGGNEWTAWTRFTARMILSFDSYRP